MDIPKIRNGISNNIGLPLSRQSGVPLKDTIFPDAFKLSISPTLNYQGVIGKLYADGAATVEHDVFGEKRSYASKDTQIEQSSSRGLSISILTDEGDTINISSESTDRVWERLYEDKQQSRYDYRATTETSDTLLLQGQLSEQEQLDLERIVAKVKDIFDIASRVSVGQQSNDDLNAALADFADGGVNENSLSSISTSLTSSTSYTEITQVSYAKPDAERNLDLANLSSGKNKDSKITASKFDTFLVNMLQNFSESFKFENGKTISYELLKDAIERLNDDESKHLKSPDVVKEVDKFPLAGKLVNISA